MTAVAERARAARALRLVRRPARGRSGLTIVPLDREAGGALLRTLRDGKLVGLLCDRDIAGNGVEVEFFGERTTLPAGPAALALRTGAPILPTAVYAGPGRDHTDGHPPAGARRAHRAAARRRGPGHPGRSPTRSRPDPPRPRPVVHVPAELAQRHVTAATSMRVALLCPYSLSRPGGVQGQVARLGPGAARRRARGRRARTRRDAPRPRVADGVRPARADALGRRRPVAVPAGQRLGGAGGAVAGGGRRARRQAVRGGGFDVVHLHEPLAPGVGLRAACSAPPRPLVGTFHRAGGSAAYRLLGPLARRRGAARLAVRCAVSAEAEATAAGRRSGGATRSSPTRWSSTASPTRGSRGRPHRRPRRARSSGATSSARVSASCSRPSPGSSRRRRRRPSCGSRGTAPRRRRCAAGSRRARAVGGWGRWPTTSWRRACAAADVLCAPSLGGESFGMVLLEAMAARTAVVASDLPGYAGGRRRPRPARAARRRRRPGRRPGPGGGRRRGRDGEGVVAGRARRGRRARRALVDDRPRPAATWRSTRRPWPGAGHWRAVIGRPTGVGPPPVHSRGDDRRLGGRDGPAGSAQLGTSRPVPAKAGPGRGRARAGPRRQRRVAGSGGSGARRWRRPSGLGRGRPRPGRRRARHRHGGQRGGERRGGAAARRRSGAGVPARLRTAVGEPAELSAAHRRRRRAHARRPPSTSGARPSATVAGPC